MNKTLKTDNNLDSKGGNAIGDALLANKTLTYLDASRKFLKSIVVFFWIS